MSIRASVLALVLAGCGESTAAPEPLRVEIGGLDAIESAVARARGNALLVNFWATWCPPCVEELLALGEVARASAGRGARVLGVSYDLMAATTTRAEVEAKVRAFLQERDLPLPTVILDASDFDAVDERFELPGGIPVTLAYDRDGKLADRHEGAATRERFEEMMRKALGP